MKNLIYRFGMSVALLGVLFLAVVALAPRANAGTPCCNITAIDAKTGVVTAKEIATGKTFQFKAADTKLLNSLKVGQGVYANFKTREVSFDGKTASGKIVKMGPAPSHPIASKPSLLMKIPYGRVSTISSTGVVAVHDPKISTPVSNPSLPGVRGPAKQEMAKGQPTPNLPPEIQLGATKTTPNPPQDPFCNTFLPVNPQPLQVGQTVAVTPDNSTAYMVGFPAVQFRYDDVSVGHMTTCVKLSSNGYIDGKSRVWTGNNLSGFEGAVKVYFWDINGGHVYETPQMGGWGINGTDIPGAPSDRTVTWNDQMPADKVGSVWKISISQINDPTDHFDDFMKKAKQVAEIIGELAKAYSDIKSGGSGSPTGPTGTGTDTGGLGGGDTVSP